MTAAIDVTGQMTEPMVRGTYYEIRLLQRRYVFAHETGGNFSCLPSEKTAYEPNVSTVTGRSAASLAPHNLKVWMPASWAEEVKVLLKPIRRRSAKDPEEPRGWARY